MPLISINHSINLTVAIVSAFIGVREQCGLKANFAACTIRDNIN